MNKLEPPPGFRSGFVGVIGRPNTGKSSLVNRLVGKKVTITSPVPLTTRSRVHGILTLPQGQLIVADTPAVHQPPDQLGKQMVAATSRAFADSDVGLWVVDASGGNDEDRQVLALLHPVTKPLVVALSKADRAHAGQLETVARNISSLRPFRALLPVSAATKHNIDELQQLLIALLPEGPQYFPPTMQTDQPEPFFLAELIREQAFALTREEVPHELAVQVEEVTPRAGQDLLYIHAIIIVARPSQKKIVIGRQGQLLKRIGEQARRAIEGERGVRVYLDLWVKVVPHWRDRLDLIRALYPD